MSRPVPNLLGLRFGRLRVVGRAKMPTRPSGHLLSVWRCCCDCGQVTVVTTHKLRSGNTQSCGCLFKEIVSRGAKRTHGFSSGHPLYETWKQMVARCHLPATNSYANYGARGISVCDRWRYGENGKHGFELFISDMGKRPDGLTLDRINNDGNYEPDNCRWATAKEQGRNRRITVDRDLVRKLWQSSQSSAAIAAQAKCHRATVCRMIKEFRADAGL